MKKSISIILTISILLCNALILIKADETETFPELEGYLTESIDNYFLPQGYDIVAVYTADAEYFYNNYVVKRKGVKKSW